MASASSDEISGQVASRTDLLERYGHISQSVLGFSFKFMIVIFQVLSPSVCHGITGVVASHPECSWANRTAVLHPVDLSFGGIFLEGEEEVKILRRCTFTTYSGSSASLTVIMQFEPRQITASMDGCAQHSTQLRAFNLRLSCWGSSKGLFFGYLCGVLKGLT